MYNIAVGCRLTLAGNSSTVGPMELPIAMLINAVLVIGGRRTAKCDIDSAIYLGTSHICTYRCAYCVHCDAMLPLCLSYDKL